MAVVSIKEYNVHHITYSNHTTAYYSYYSEYMYNGTIIIIVIVIVDSR